MQHTVRYSVGSVRLPAAVLIAVCCTAAACAHAKTPVARIIPQSRTVQVSQSFTVTVLVESDSPPSNPDLAHVTDFHVSKLIGGGPVVDAKAGTYAYEYHFLPRRPGELVIGPVDLTVAGGKLTAPGVPLSVLLPEPSGDSRLVVKLSAERCFVGQPVRLSVTWQVAIPFGAIKAVDLTLPVMRDPRFGVMDRHVPPEVDRSRDIGLPVSDTRIISKAGTAELDGRKFSTLTFEKILIPGESGMLEIPAAAVLCAVLPGPVKSRGAWNRYVSYFDNEFFNKDIPGGHRRLFASSQPLRLRVDPLPAEGRPDNFSGLVGACSVSVGAAPTTVVAGAPITLTIRISGSKFPETVNLPPLSRQGALAMAFAIPGERSAAKIAPNAAVFTQTVRPLSSSVTKVPPIELAYFDPDARKYSVARSAPVKLTVKDAAIADTQNGGPALPGGGLRHNYYGPDVLVDRGGRLGGLGGIVLWAVLLALPPGLYVLLAVSTAMRRRRDADPASVLAKAAWRAFRKRIAEIRRAGGGNVPEQIDRAVCTYLAERLALNRGSVTYRDAARRLEEARVDADLLEELRVVFDTCQGYRFGGGGDVPGDSAAAVDAAEWVIERIEGALQ